MLLFFKIMMAEFIAEMGDKTQLMLIAMTSKYKMRHIIIGTAVAVMVLNALAVLAGGLVGSLIPEWLIKIIAAGGDAEIADALAGKGEALGPGVGDDGIVPEPGQPADLGPLVGQFPVGLVGDDVDRVAVFRLLLRQHRRHGLQRSAGENGAGGIVGVVDDQDLGERGDRVA